MRLPSFRYGATTRMRSSYKHMDSPRSSQLLSASPFSPLLSSVQQMFPLRCGTSFRGRVTSRIRGAGRADMDSSPCGPRSGKRRRWARLMSRPGCARARSTFGAPPIG